MTTLHPNAPASRMAQARHPLLRREISAFHPLSAQMALTSISMSLPNCLLLVSECILNSAAPLLLLSLAFWFCVCVGEDAAAAAAAAEPSTLSIPPPLALLSDECRLVEPQLHLDLVVRGVNGTSCASGWGMKLVMASTTRTRGALAVADDSGRVLGAVLDAESARSCSRDHPGLLRRSERWIDVYP